GGKVAMEVPGQGVFVYNTANGTWQHPTTTNASELDIDEAGEVAMEIPNQGVYLYDTNSGTWQHPTTTNATLVAG
ncbi:MAG TPA: hypothetical protein VKE74_09360, partial [Gemmataceae bacterium]|nr:hypothetical protein [Gemmataceae bacterium]